MSENTCNSCNGQCPECGRDLSQSPAPDTQLNIIHIVRRWIERLERNGVSQNGEYWIEVKRAQEILRYELEQEAEAHSTPAPDVVAVVRQLEGEAQDLVTSTPDDVTTGHVTGLYRAIEILKEQLTKTNTGKETPNQRKHEK